MTLKLAPIAFCTSAIVTLTCFGGSASSQTADEIPIDPGFPPVPSQPFSLPISYKFNTSFDGIEWTEEEKLAVRQDINYLGSFFEQQPAFVEEYPDITLRWAGDDFFSNWGKVPVDGFQLDLNLTGALGFAAKPIFTPPAEWKDKYPLGEIYFNKNKKWHFDQNNLPANDEYDFSTVVLHELIHMLSVNTHSDDKTEVMYKGLKPGETRRVIQQSDKDLLKKAGYDLRIAPEPSSTLSLLALGTLGAASTLKRKLKSTKSTGKETTKVG
jgi:hypothetical protein